LLRTKAEPFPVFLVRGTAHAIDWIGLETDCCAMPCGNTAIASIEPLPSKLAAVVFCPSRAAPVWPCNLLWRADIDCAQRRLTSA
jgi:hypothetical protein